MLTTAVVDKAAQDFHRSRDISTLDHLSVLEADGGLPAYPPVHEFFRRASVIVRQVADHKQSADAGADELLALTKQVDFIPPVIGLADPSNQWFRVTPRRLIRTSLWRRFEAPEQIRPLFADNSARSLVLEAIRMAWSKGSEERQD